MKKKILFLYSSECYKLPPFLTILDCLKDEYDLSVVSYETSKQRKILEESYPEVKFMSKLVRPERESFVDKVIRHIFYPIKFHYEAKRLIQETPHDLLWIIHEKTMVEFSKILPKGKYIVSSYELNDMLPDFLKKSREGMQNAKMVISAEYNRSCIMRVWYGLSYTPIVVPNKPLQHPLERNIRCEFSEVFEGKKIILYQGYIQKVRNIDILCKAVEELKDYKLVLMGGGDQDYIDYLKQNYKNLIFTGFVNPPHHLNITSHGYIGVIKYDFIYLNHAYCAPNKIWEYTGFDIPVLGNDLPALEEAITRNNAGICTNLDDLESVKKAIVEIDMHYDSYAKNAHKLYNSVDIKSLINSIADNYC